MRGFILLDFGRCVGWKRGWFYRRFVKCLFGCGVYVVFFRVIYRREERVLRNKMYELGRRVGRSVGLSWRLS